MRIAAEDVVFPAGDVKVYLNARSPGGEFGLALTASHIQEAALNDDTTASGTVLSDCGFPIHRLEPQSLRVRIPVLNSDEALAEPAVVTTFTVQK